ncbi:MAG: IS110 family transposase [Chloroflexi bacterium]|nr:IS110 family transposase [Chloroflexota bacterium]MBV9546023.1 IS110 family transposase [Chloroflexota bacterium]
MGLTCGIDWAEDHHDVAIVDESGNVLAERRIGVGAAGFAELLGVLAECGDRMDQLIPVAIENSGLLLVAALLAGGRKVYAINPLAVSRYRDRHRASRAKSDARDAIILANILRTDAHAHRPMPTDSDAVKALRVLTRAQQDAVWDRVGLTNRIRGALRRYFPAAIAAFERGGKHRLDSAACRVILCTAPTPSVASKLSLARLQALLRRAGRSRGIDAEARRLQTFLRRVELRQRPEVEDAMGIHLQTLLHQLDAICDAVGVLTAAAEQLFLAHRSAAIITSMPGAGPLTGARLLAEIGDDANRFSDARALKAYAGAAPITRDSGKSHHVSYRRAKNDRIASAGYAWVRAALLHDLACRTYYQRRRRNGDRHVGAQRNLFNKLLGKLYHCLQTGELYDAAAAFSDHPVPITA